MRILLAVDDSEIAVRAVHFVVRLSSQMTKNPDIFLLNVGDPLPREIEDAIGVQVAVMYHTGKGDITLAMANKILDEAGIAHDVHFVVGDPAETIVKHAIASQCDLIVMGSHGGHPFQALFLGSVTSKVLAHSPMPVTVVK